MVLVSGATLLSILSGTRSPRHELALTGMQLAVNTNMTWTNKKLILRNVPYTATNPTDAQLDVRINFGKLAQEAARMSAEEVARMVGGKVVGGGKQLIQLPDGRILPKVAAYIEARFSGFESPYRGHITKRSFHSLGELEKIAEVRIKARATV